MTKRLTMTIEQVAKKLGIGRNNAYEAAHCGQIPTIRIGKRFLVPIAALEATLLNASKEPSGKRFLVPIAALEATLLNASKKPSGNSRDGQIRRRKKK